MYECGEGLGLSGRGGGRGQPKKKNTSKIGLFHWAKKRKTNKKLPRYMLLFLRQNLVEREEHAGGLVDRKRVKL